MNNIYIKILRPDHWIKQFFILPGILFAVIVLDISFYYTLYYKIILGFFATCLIASANYSINEYLDAEFDKFHPTKKYRPIVTDGINGTYVYLMWGGISLIGLSVSTFLGTPFFIVSVWLWIMGILYNVKPFRTKDIPILDVLSESINNAIRLLMGWFILSENTIPPCSIIFGYWMGGAFLMAMKRFAEYRMINDEILAGLYRKSFSFYTERSLMISSFVYAILSVFFCGIFLIKYRIELILFIPLFIGVFAYYFNMAFDQDSAVQKPEKLFHEKGLMLYCCILFFVFFILMIYDMPFLNILVSNTFIRI